MTHISVVHGAMKKPITGQSQLLKARFQRVGSMIHQMMTAARGPNRNSDGEQTAHRYSDRVWGGGSTVV